MSGPGPRPRTASNQSSQPSRNSSDTGKSLPCFKHGCDFRGHAMSLVLRHAKIIHKLSYCRGCCVFYDDAESKYCPGCQLFCMSPRCFHAALAVGTGTALGQRHRRTPRCPTIWGRTSGVSEEQLLDYLRRLDQESQAISNAQVRPGASTEPSESNSPATQNGSNDMMETAQDIALSSSTQHSNTVSPVTYATLCSLESRQHTSHASAPSTFLPYELDQTATAMASTIGGIDDDTQQNQDSPFEPRQWPDFELPGDDPDTWIWDGVHR